MRSVTSSFNRAIYHKNMLRFWPIWAIYTMIFAFAMPMQVLVQNRNDQNLLMEDIRELLWKFARYQDEMIPISLCFGVFIAMAVFSYLYTSRSACMMHALPISRKTLYFTNYLSGLSMLLIPNLVILVLTLSSALCRGVWEPIPVLVWFFCQSASGVFFFSFASFCAMFTGNVLALPVFYGVLNFLVMGVGTLLTPLLSATLYGFQFYSDSLQQAALWLTPVYRMLESNVTQTIRQYDVLTASWSTVGYQIINLHIYAIYLVAGLVIALLGYLVYLSRETERAGDVVAERRAYPLFRYGVGICGGLSMGIVNVALLNLDMTNVPALVGLSVLWGVVAYFAAEMLLQKTFKVLATSWKRAGVFALVLVLTFVGISMDFMGYSKNIPQLDQIQEIDVRVGTYGNTYSADLTQLSTMEKVVALHGAIAETGKPADVGSSESQTNTVVAFCYILKDGSQLERSYDVTYFKDEVDVAGSVTQLAMALVEDENFRQEETGLDISQQASVVHMSLEGYWDSQRGDTTYQSIESADDQRVLREAIELDIAEGNWDTAYFFNDQTYQQYIATRYQAYLVIEWGYQEGDASDGTTYVSENMGNDSNFVWDYARIKLTPQCVHTIDALYQLGILNDTRYLVTESELELLQEN